MSSPVDIYVCVTCQPESERTSRPGKILFEAMQNTACANMRVHAVECLCVCKRPCTVAVSAPNKWTYIVGGLDPASDVEALCQYAEAYGADANGTPPLSSRPASIKRGTIARIPPGVPYAT